MNINDDDIKKRNAKSHLDGYGILYKDDDGFVEIKSEKPIIDDNCKINCSLLSKIKNIYSNYVMVFIRKNNLKNHNKLNNVQPFHYKNKFFLHNGEFNKYCKYLKDDLLSKINKKYLDIIGNDLDSKILFCLLLSNINFKDTMDDMYSDIHDIINFIQKITNNDFNISLNFILSDDKLDTHICLRYRTCNEIAPSLYYNLNYHNGIVISSEPIDLDKNWKLLKQQLLIINKNDHKIYDLTNN